jgi:glutamate racemase
MGTVRLHQICHSAIHARFSETELAKRCPRMRLVSQACPSLVSLIEAGAPEADLKDAVFGYVRELVAKAPEAPHSAILGCTHYPLVAHLFKAALPASTRLFSQPDIVANALEDYISRHPEVAPKGSPYVQYTTSGNPAEVSVIASRLLGMPVNFVGF